MPASRPPRGWSISRSWAITPPSGEAYDAAYIVRLTHDDGAVHDLVVEFEAASALASVGYAEEIAGRTAMMGARARLTYVEIRRRRVDQFRFGR